MKERKIIITIKENKYDGYTDYQILNIIANCHADTGMIENNINENDYTVEVK